MKFNLGNREILTGHEPYPDMGAMEVAIGVTTKGLRLQIPPQTDIKLAQLMICESRRFLSAFIDTNQVCWTTQPLGRPDFDGICNQLGISDRLNRMTEATEEANLLDEQE